MQTAPPQSGHTTNPQLNSHSTLNPRSLGAANESRVVVGHVECEASARGVEAVLALDGQRQLGLVAGQAQRQEQLDPAAVELRHRERVVGCGAAGGLDDGTLKGAAQQKRVALPLLHRVLGSSMRCPIHSITSVRMLRFYTCDGSPVPATQPRRSSSASALVVRFPDMRSWIQA